MISISFLSAKEIPASYFDSLIRIQNEKITELNNEILLLKNRQMINDGELKQQFKELKNPDLPWSIKFIPIFVTIMSVLFTVGAGVISWVGFVKSKEAENEVKSARKDIATFKDDLQKSYDRYLKKLDDKINEFSDLEKETANKIQANLDSFAENSLKIMQVEKDLSSHKTYLKESIELLFELHISCAIIAKSKECLKAIFIKRAVSNLYSFEEKERFSGITALGQIGTMSEIVHLEHIINDKSENVNNRSLATKAIVSINMSTKL